MSITPLDNFEKVKLVFPKDDNGRTIFLYRLQDCRAVSCFYPDVIFESEGKFYNPIDERIMSLNVSQEQNVERPAFKHNFVDTQPYFLFCYNTDNYFHFIYDTLPYLITFLKFRKELNLKLLMNFPHVSAASFYRFVVEFLALLGITHNDWEIINRESLYRNVYFSSSFTHGEDSNVAPREEIFDIYRDLAISSLYFDSETPKKIYVSRQSWKHGDRSNMGTDYTSRRSLENEARLVDFLQSNGFTEVFCEKLSTLDKLAYFRKATHVVGALGGGMVNCVFSKPDAKVLGIASPCFLDVNRRFLHCLSRTKSSIFTKTAHISDGEFQLYTRVKVGDIIGEIIEVDGPRLTIAYTGEKVAGWNAARDFKMITVSADECAKLDEGLNSPWKIDMKAFKEFYNGNYLT